VALFARIIALSAALLVIAAGATFVTGSGAFDGGDSSSQRPTMVAQESPTDGLIADFQQRLARAPRSIDMLAQLSALYLQKARESGDPSHYARAESLLQEASALAPDDHQVLAGQSALALARHDFAGALNIAERLPKDRAETFGLLGDALVELGRYDQAFAAFQRMADLKPDSAALARIAYARELTGDRAGAIDAMAEAAASAGSRGENAAWLRVQLGHLHFGGGDLASAERAYLDAQAALPGYVHALAGLGRVAAARGEFAEAIDLYRQVTESFPLPEYVIALGDVYEAAGRSDEAERQYALVEAIATLFRENGVDTDLEVALFFADRDRVDEDLVGRAREAYARQPGNVHAADVLSWVLYKAGQIDEANEYSRVALRLGTQDALMLFHAGKIKEAAGDVSEGRTLIERARALNPHVSLVSAGAATFASR
jgi:tetratricopeptide (TPR) repeat protein